MAKNKFGEETEWELRKMIPDKSYPCTWYFWINPEGKVIYQRSVEPLGFIPILVENIVGKYIEDFLVKQFPKIQNHQMTDEHLSKGWLLI